MDLTRAQKIRLGTFMVAGSTLFFGSVLALTGLAVWTPRDTYTVRFTDNVGGLEKSAPVKYQGLAVGRVEDLIIAPDDPKAIEVTLALDPRTRLYEGTKALLDASGLTGLKTVNLTSGDPRAPLIEPGSRLPAESALMDRLSGRAEEIAIKVEAVANQLARWTSDENRERVEHLIDSIDRLSGSLTLFLDTNRDDLQAALAGVNRASNAFADVAGAGSRGITAIQEDVGRTLTDVRSTLRAVREPLSGLDANEVRETVTATKNAMGSLEARLSGEEIGGAIERLNRVLNNLTRLLEDVDLSVRAGREDFTATLSYVRQAAEDLREFSRIIAQDPAALLRGRE